MFNVGSEVGSRPAKEMKLKVKPNPAGRIWRRAACPSCMRPGETNTGASGCIRPTWSGHLDQEGHRVMVLLSGGDGGLGGWPSQPWAAGCRCGAGGKEVKTTF